MKEFDSLYGKLNTAQKKAVDIVEGPVMVLAGPGTGKTQVLAMRVANILRKTQAKPGNILCLTFSTSGATAMRERLRSLIGPNAYGVTVSTIHGFCNDIIASHPIVFDQWSLLEQISDVESYRAVNTIIDSLLPDLILVNKKSPYKRTKDILSRISLLKREGKTDEKELKRVADEYEKTLSEKSKSGTLAHEKNLLTARKFRELIEVFIRYQAVLQDSGRYDYNDMILSCVAALKEEDWMLAEIQERYQYILVDEFQDTNGAQYGLIELLVTQRTQEDFPNLFVVGDDDQAIYRFQGANLTNILRFRERFTSAAVVVLTTSYRCSQPILDAASSLISKNTERLIHRIDGLSKDLISSSTKKSKDPILLFSPSDMTEPTLIADLLEERISRGTPPENIAVLTQTNAELRPIYDVLRSRNISAELSGKVDLLSHPLVGQILVILSAIHRPGDSGKLAAAFSCGTFHCHPADLGRVFSHLRDSQSGDLLSLALQFGSAGGTPDPVTLHDAASFLSARDVLVDLHQKLPSRTIIETLECLLKESGIVKPLSSRPEDAIDPIDFAAVQEFFDRMKLRCYESPHYEFESFISDLEFYQEPEYGDLRLSYDLPHLTDAGVQLMTAHRSKGLEFDVVILANFRDRHWDNRYKMSSISIPEDRLFGWEKDQKTYEKSQDERRIAFVAMTRARHELIFTCPKQLTSGDSSKSVSPSAFFAEAGDLKEEERELKSPESASTLLLPIIRDMDSEFSSFLRHRLKDYALSVTALNHFLEDPLLFLKSDLLQTPQSKQSNLAYGNAVHDALRRWGMSMKAGVPLTQTAFIRAFSEYLENKELLIDKEHKRLLKLGEESLPRYYKERLQDSHPIIGKIEHPIKTHLKDIPIKGKLDRIDHFAPDSARISVIDFKTGRPKADSQIKEEGYYRQLVFYALLLKYGEPIYKPEAFILDFIGESGERPVLRTYQITDADIAELSQVIADVWKKILALDFTPL